MAKKIKTQVKLNLPAGAATPAPPVGPVLGQHGIPIMDFIKQYNERTSQQKGQVIPAVITVYEDNSFTFVTKLSPVSEMIKKKLGIQKGGGNAGRENVAKLTKQQVKEIAEEKMKDLNAVDVEGAMNIVAGTARSMGIEVGE
ncbi:50S ribosomal protein L11 [Candidatus Roizmanbacteria bacterium RIFCSPHIGHO2_02_FULL_40_9]|uniref:Large ribosomal subunit protein uL11 n=2 Tax=Candidatus Roizmaniibacteriota TaxID=1752723 RepID=A0A1F7ILX6_9BACT|nr:MAG: 50S ribosomal protein L11 [Candidatus Roizmanbacteria bacterium RIFCSPHIGHO2_02_FULL_40_9]OGK44358.1 MAG: 50S ribosomal protein L11 [Candidatus Roizmanbacteria bacterium RIFCSPLOWO2_01_FULL_38_11]